MIYLLSIGLNLNGKSFEQSLYGSQYGITKSINVNYHRYVDITVYHRYSNNPLYAEVIIGWTRYNALPISPTPLPISPTPPGQ